MTIAAEINAENAPKPDYYEVVYLKRADQAGLWVPMTMPFPTKAEADDYAALLRAGNQGAVTVKPRYWP